MSSIVDKIHDMEEEKAEEKVYRRNPPASNATVKDMYFAAALTGLLATPATEGMCMIYTVEEIVSMAWQIAEVSLEKRK